MLPGSSLPPASASKTARDAAQVRARWMAAISSGLAQRHAGHVVVRRRIVLDVAAADRLDRSPDHAACTSRSPCRRASRRTTALSAACSPPATRADDRALGDAVAVADLRVVRQVAPTRGLGAGAPRAKSSDGALVGQRRAAVEDLHAASARLADVAQQDARRPAGRRGRSASCRRRGRLGVADDLVVGLGGLADRPSTASSTPITLSLVASFEPA